MQSIRFAQQELRFLLFLLESFLKKYLRNAGIFITDTLPPEAQRVPCMFR
ncbi:MAG: hypothetical protein JWM20_196 [Patescibacteria group bacterium]|nr:hypothetical protein [Patescibacteria group bacterium]